MLEEERKFNALSEAQFKVSSESPADRALREQRQRRRALAEALESEQLYVDMLTELELGLGGPLTSGAVLEAVRPLLGIPYKFGGETVQGMDCSAFTRLVYRKMGVNLPRTSREQAKAGVPVDRSSLKPGDLVFFAVQSDTIDHVGIIVGPDRIAHATGRRGRVVIERLSSVYRGKFAGACRVGGKKK